MKTLKILSLFALLAMSAIIANAQGAGNINESIFFKAKYKKDKVWDVQRSPAYPIAGQDWTLSGLKGSLDGGGATVDWGQDRYVMMVAEPDNSNDANSLINDVTSAGGKYKISLQLFESNGTLVKVLSKWGKIAGIGEKGFMYECEGHYGTFFSVAAVPASTVIVYRPTLAVISKLSEIIKSSDLTRSLEKANGVAESSFFSNKYTKENVWDVQRSPAYPVAEQVWTLSGLKGSLDSKRANVDWGSGRYVMLIAEVDNTNNSNSLVDDISGNGTKLNISLKLYESNGNLVKVVSNWGKLYGIGAEGFMYEVEGKYGTFFSVARVSASDVIKYTPKLSTITKLSQLTKGLDAVKSSENLKVTENVVVVEPLKAPEIIKGVTNAPLFTNKYTKEQVWDVMRMPIFVNPAKEWTLSKFKGAIEASGAPIDWGNGRYVMFIAQVAGTGTLYPLTDDVNNSLTKYTVSLRLFEKDGTFVKVVSAWGRFLGFGEKGFIYEAEGKYNEFFAYGAQNATDVIKYIPGLAKATKLSELVKVTQTTKVSDLPNGKVTETGRVTDSENLPGMSKVTESENISEVPVKENTKKEEVVKSNMPFDIYKIKFKKNQVWDAGVGETADEAKVAYVMNGPANYEKSWDESGQIDWGKNNDRYMMFFLQKGDGRMPIIDDINNDEPTLLSVKMFEATGKPLGETYRCGMVKNVGPNGFIYFIASSEHQFNIYFSKTPLKINDTVNYIPIKMGNGLNRMSELQFGTVVTQNDKLRKTLSLPGGISTVVSKPGLAYGKMTDQDGNTYKTITIGTQTWMAENLRVTKYRNGDLIPIVNLSQEWNDELKTGALCSYENTADKNKVATNGLLYNWYAAVDNRNIAPAGWHVPTANEWATLVNTLGGENLAGGKMKEAGTTHWTSPNTGATNENGFNASPAGLRSNEQARFGELKSFVGYWTSTIDAENEERAFYYVLRNEDSNCLRDNFPYTYAISIRLVKD
jgi:uncharacterized protein (TIGR02145 family)